MKKITALVLSALTVFTAVALAQTPGTTTQVQIKVPKLQLDAIVFEDVAYGVKPADEITPRPWFDVGAVNGQDFYIQATLKNANLVTVVSTGGTVGWTDTTPEIPVTHSTNAYLVEAENVGDDTVFKFYFSGYTDTARSIQTLTFGKNIFGSVSVNGTDYVANFSVVRD